MRLVVVCIHLSALGRRVNTESVKDHSLLGPTGEAGGRRSTRAREKPSRGEYGIKRRIRFISFGFVCLDTVPLSGTTDPELELVEPPDVPKLISRVAAGSKKCKGE